MQAITFSFDFSDCFSVDAFSDGLSLPSLSRFSLLFSFDWFNFLSKRRSTRSLLSRSCSLLACFSGSFDFFGSSETDAFGGLS